MNPTTGDERPGTPPATEVRVGLPEWVGAAVDWERSYAGDEARMRLVVALARENVQRRTGGPFAAGVFDRSGRLVSVGVNVVERVPSSAAHAEIVAIMLAQQRVASFTLRGDGVPRHELFSSCAPCAMCLGAVLWSGVRRLVWGALREDALALGFEEGPVFPESIAYLEARGVKVVGGILREEAREVLELYRRLGGRIYNP